MKRVFCSAAIALAATASTFAAEVPQVPHDDRRMGVIAYNEQKITHVYVQRGVATHIALGKGEAIRKSAAGFGSSCRTDDEDNRWCVYAETGDNNIFVKPKSGSSDYNNLEVVTNLRNYSFVFEVLPTVTDGKALHRVTFTFPEEEREKERERLANEDSKRKLAAAQALPARNWNYWMQIVPGGDDIAPTRAYDNGQFTYLQFPNNRSIPAVFGIASDGTETMVSRHVEGDTLVLHRVGKRFVLRLDYAVVGLWNESFDVDGVPLANGTTVLGFDRVTKGR